jgi:hypothetical protein
VTTARDAAVAVFRRINRRRNSGSEIVEPADGSADPFPGGPPLAAAADEFPSVTSAPVSGIDPMGPARAMPRPADAAAEVHAALRAARNERASLAAETEADTFPRSATMRAILKHPVLAASVGLPAAGLLLSSPATRRLLATALKIGTGPELQHLLQLSANIRSAGRPPGTSPVRPPGKAPLS